MSETVHKTLPEHYHGLVSTLIDKDGIYPHSAAAVSEDGGLSVMALDMDIHGWTQQFWDHVQGLRSEAREVIFGLDMRTAPNQGTEFADALVFVYWVQDPVKKLADPSCFKVGVINYQHEPRIVRPIDWNNSHWTHWMMSWLQKTRPPFLIRTMKTKPATP